MLYGRDAERARIGALLEAARASKSAALVIRGDPGIGKTALLEDTRDRAADMHVLSARGVESESELPFAALHQLLRPALPQIERLPDPQAAALRAALGEGGEVAGQERFLVFAACLSLLSELAERRPVLCLVDDAHWLDTGSAAALEFVARRLDAEGVVMLFGVREGEATTFGAVDIPSLRLDGLDQEAAERLLSQGVGIEASPGVRDRLLDQTGGNALALLELPSVLSAGQLAGDEPLPADLPLTSQVESVFLQRVRRLPSGAQRLLLVAAADDTESAAIVVRAAERGEAGHLALDAAEQAGLLSVHGSRVTFRHPLVRSAVYSAATSTERRAAHRALAEELEGDEEQFDRRAWHLAAAALEPDDAVVAALDDAAARAQKRGANGPAVRALERAAELTQDPAARAVRLAEAARCAGVAGLDEQAVSLADRAEPVLAEDPLRRAELARVRGRAEIRRGIPANALRPLTDAAREIMELDPGLALDLLLDAAWAAQEGADPQALAEVCGLAEGLASSVDDERSRFLAAVMTGLGAIAREDAATAFSNIALAVAHGGESDEPLHVTWAASCSMFLGDERTAGRLYERAVALARPRGELGGIAPALAFHGLQKMAAQQYDQAAAAAVEAEQLVRELGADNLFPMLDFVLATVAAVRGNDEEATRRAESAFERAQAHGLRASAARPIWSLALLDLGRGRWADALARLESIPGARLSLTSAIGLRSLPDRIEAAVRAGQPDAARAALEAYEAWAAKARLVAAWVSPRLASCRALVADGDVATEHYEEALQLRADALPFDLGRIHLLYGEHLRRERRRTDSRVQFRAALEAFERLGAEPWADRARMELRASGETARRRDPSTTARLTPQELQIARFVAEGLSNKEVAAQLFLSPRTIDSHLRSVFAKLEISSRTQLARIPLEDELVPAPG